MAQILHLSRGNIWSHNIDDEIIPFVKDNHRELGFSVNYRSSYSDIQIFEISSAYELSEDQWLIHNLGTKTSVANAAARERRELGVFDNTLLIPNINHSHKIIYQDLWEKMRRLMEDSRDAKIIAGRLP
jgi:hypothetical protein